MTPPADELNRATWALFLTQAKYKCFVDQSDSLVNVAYDYFMKGEDAQRKALVLYLTGGLLYDNNQHEKALNFYLEADDELEKISNDTLGFLIDSHICMIYAYQSLYDYAIEYGWKSNEYAMRSKNIDYIISSYIRIARANSKVNLDESIKCYEKAISIANEYGLMKDKATALIEVADRYYHKSQEENYEKALSYMKEAMRIKVTDQSLLILGDLYRRTNSPDSAYFYLHKAAASKNIHTSRSAYQGLYYLSKKLGHYQKAVDYSEELWERQDSINNIARNQALIEMQEKYNEQRVRDELTTQMLLQKQRTWTIVGIGMVVLITTALFVAYRIRLRNKERIARLAEAEDRIDTLSRMLEEAQKATSEEEKDQAFIKRILLQQLGVIRLVANTPTAQNQALLRQLAEIGNDEAPAEELIVWSDLYPIIDRLFDNFHTRLMQRFGSVLTDKEVQTCCLVCAGFSTKEIAVITRQAVSTVYIRKTTARQKMGAPEGADIVEWVRKG
jgi:DNA-binding CsgD family transcriptional regulator